MPQTRPFLTPRWASVLVWALVSIWMFAEKAGQTTSDTKTPLIEDPGTFLRGATSLWNQTSSLGELQNQAYGYLFPQGPFLYLGQVAGLPAWVVERLWVLAVLFVAFEGTRRLALSMGLGVWAAWFAGMAYAFNPRAVAQVAVRSAEVLPGAVLPWVLLPLVLHMTGRLGVRRAVLFSVIAFSFSGSVNGTATGAPLLLAVILLVWGARRALISWRAVAGWFGLLLLTSAWWLYALMSLNKFSPPFFDFVEDANATTSVTSAFGALRGLSNWVNYTSLSASPNWPAGFELAYEPWLVLSTGLLAAVSLWGLVRWDAAWRTPMTWGAVSGFVLLTVASANTWGSPLGADLRALLDGALALLRNVAKIDPVLRLPLALGLGVAVAETLRWSRERHSHAPAKGRLRRGLSVLAPVGVGVLVAATMAPIAQLNTRTPGWDEIPQYWRQAASYLGDSDRVNRTWIVPGSGFGVQDWGWTMDEPYASIAETEWFTRSQVPLVPPSSIRMISSLEESISGGTGSPYLGRTLARLGVGYVLVRHDLKTDPGTAFNAQLASAALYRSGGIKADRVFGGEGGFPKIELFRVTPSKTDDRLRVAPESEVVTVAGTASDVLAATGQSVVNVDRPVVVQGDDGWDEPASVVGDSYRSRGRDFGQVQWAEGPMLARGESDETGRVVANYPGNEGSVPSYVTYDGSTGVTASSSQAFPRAFGNVRGENAPWAAFDGSDRTGWRTAVFENPRNQWAEARFNRPRRWGTVRVLTPLNRPGLLTVSRVKVTAGGTSRIGEVDPADGVATVDMGGVWAPELRVTVTRVLGDERSGPVEISEVRAGPLPIERTLELAEYDLSDSPAYVFGAQSETRACIPTLLGPQCEGDRYRVPEEDSGMKRTFEVPADGVWSFWGTAVARAEPETFELLNAWKSRTVRASSVYLSDPGVAPRFSHDGNALTSWISDPQDPAPTLNVWFRKKRTVNRLNVLKGVSPGVTPTRATIRSGDEVRDVRLGTGGWFEPITTQHLSIEFSNPTRPNRPISISEFNLAPGKVSVPYDASAETGAVCGTGPELRIDGTSHPTKASGSLADVAGGGPLTVESCGGPIELDAGTHRIEFRPSRYFQPTGLTLFPLDGEQQEPRRRRSSDRELTSPFTGTAEGTAALSAGSASLLVTDHNFNVGWRASLNGKELKPQRVDGWAQGWRVPAGAGGTVRVEYAPEGAYRTVVGAGLAVFVLSLLLALVLLWRTRLAPGTQPPVRPDRPWLDRIRARDAFSRRLLAGSGLLAAAGVAFLVAGWAGPIGVCTAAVLWWARIPSRWAGMLCLVGASVWAAVHNTQHMTFPPIGVATLAGVGFVLFVLDRFPARR